MEEVGGGKRRAPPSHFAMVPGAENERAKLQRSIQVDARTMLGDLIKSRIVVEKDTIAAKTFVEVTDISLETFREVIGDRACSVVPERYKLNAAC